MITQAMYEGEADPAGAGAIDWLRARAITCPERVALATPDGAEIGFGELDDAADLAADRLLALGAAPGEPVSISLEPGIAAAVAIHAALRLGAVARMLAPGEEPADAGEPHVAEPLMGRGSAPSLAAPRRPGARDPLCLIRTSGTSGTRKWVELTRSNHLASAVGSAFNLGVLPGDRWLCCLPIHHVGGFTIPIRSVIYGTATTIHPRFETDRVAAALESEPITLVSLVATQLARLLDAGAALERPRAIVLGGGPAPPELIGAALERGARVVQSYGLTEACSQVTTLAPSAAPGRVGSSGRPLLTTRVEIGEAGEILVSGATVAPGSLAPDCRLHTGDVGELDEDGFLWVRDRLSDLIVTGGENVLPGRVEDALRSHPGVADVAVVGLPDPEWQEAVSAFVVAAADPPAAEALRAHAARELARHEIPKRITFVAELPRGENGKLRRRELRERHGGAAPPG